MELWLLVPGAQCSALSNDEHSFAFGGQDLRLRGPIDVSLAPSFVCVSYVWGSGRVANPLDPNRSISDVTLPSLQAAVSSCRDDPSLAYWIDAFCVPTQQPQRSTTLASMGYIYARASKTVACLSHGSQNILQQMSVSDRVDEHAVRSLEDEPWIESVWTYQEVVNSTNLLIVHREEPLPIERPGPIVATISAVEAEHFFNCVGMTLSTFKKNHSLTSFDVRRKYPRIDAFEDLVADWFVAGYLERSAMQVLCNLDRRKADDPYNTFYAAIGSISQDRYDRHLLETVESLAAAFMKICEEKGDFSFIYTASSRVEHSWRPQETVLRSLVPWHCYGSRQTGYFDGDDLVLTNVALVELQADLGEVGKSFVSDWLVRTEQLSREQEMKLADSILVQLAFESLVEMGYTGSPKVLNGNQGLFFPQQDINDALSEHIEVYISLDIGWVFGKPAIAKVAAHGTVCFVPGVFVGEARNMSAISARLS